MGGAEVGGVGAATGVTGSLVGEAPPSLVIVSSASFMRRSVAF